MTYTFSWHVPAIALAIAVIAVAIGFVLRRKRMPTRLVVLAFAVAALLGVIVAPMLALDRVVLDDEKLEQTTGFWFAPSVKGFRIGDVEFITIGTATDNKGRSHEVWNVRLKGGQLLQIDPGDLWEMNDQDIIRRLREAGVDVR